MIPWNINKRRTNTLMTITKKTITKDDSNNYIYCNQCNIILGFEYKNSDDKDDDDNKSNKENIFYLLKKNIKERNNRNININLISFKENLLKTIKEEFSDIFKEIKNINIQINVTPLTKQNFEDFGKFYKKKEFDYFTFIIHKMEGRIFLLGKNGYFNAGEDCLIKKENSNLFFILVSNEIDDDENKKIIEELIYQGEEESMEKYYKNERIIFLDNFKIKKDINNKKNWFINKIRQIYGNENNEYEYNYSKNNYFIECEKNIYVMDKRKIDNMIEYLNNKDKKGLSGCFS
jgi:hypothetical protein